MASDSRRELLSHPACGDGSRKRKSLRVLLQEGDQLAKMAWDRIPLILSKAATMRQDVQAGFHLGPTGAGNRFLWEEPLSELPNRSVTQKTAGHASRHLSGGGLRKPAAPTHVVRLDKLAALAASHHEEGAPAEVRRLEQANPFITHRMCSLLTQTVERGGGVASPPYLELAGIVMHPSMEWPFR